MSAIVGIPLVAKPNCQSIAGKPIDKAIGALVTEHDARGRRAGSGDPTRDRAQYEEADQLRGRAIERAQIEADLAATVMMVDPNNRLVADTLEEWNNRLRALAEARGRRVRQRDEVVLDDAIRQRLVAMTADFRNLWDDPSMPNRERKRLLSPTSSRTTTLIKIPAERITKIHVRFKGGKTETDSRR